MSSPQKPRPPARILRGVGSRICHAGSIVPRMPGEAANAEPPQASVVIPALGHGKQARWGQGGAALLEGLVLFLDSGQVLPHAGPGDPDG